MLRKMDFAFYRQNLAGLFKTNIYCFEAYPVDKFCLYRSRKITPTINEVMIFFGGNKNEIHIQSKFQISVG